MGDGSPSPQVRCSPMNDPCTRCHVEPRATGQRWCRGCRAEWNRQHRPAHGELTDEQRRRANARAYAGVYRRRGKLVPQPCETCGDANVEMRHDDYTKPLEVRWLCRRCRHLELRPQPVIDRAQFRARLDELTESGFLGSRKPPDRAVSPPDRAVFAARLARLLSAAERPAGPARGAEPAAHRPDVDDLVGVVDDVHEPGGGGPAAAAVDVTLDGVEHRSVGDGVHQVA